MPLPIVDHHHVLRPFYPIINDHCHLPTLLLNVDRFLREGAVVALHKQHAPSSLFGNLLIETVLKKLGSAHLAGNHLTIRHYPVIGDRVGNADLTVFLCEVG